MVLINKEKKAQEQERELQARRVMRRAVERTPVQRTAESAGTFEHISGKPDFEEQETEPEHRYQPSAEQLEIEQVGIRKNRRNIRKYSRLRKKKISLSWKNSLREEEKNLQCLNGSINLLILWIGIISKDTQQVSSAARLVRHFFIKGGCFRKHRIV